MGKYNIQIASKLSGVGTHTLRAWEKRYNAVAPSRNESGRRLYSDDDIEKLRLLSELCSLGSSIGTIAQKPVEELKAFLKKLGKTEEFEPQQISLNGEDTSKNFQASLDGLMLAIKQYKLDIIAHEIEKLKITHSPRDLALDIISPLIQEVGIRVYRGELNISQEQALSSMLKFHIGHVLFRNYKQKYKNPNLVALATPETDHSEFNLLLYGLLCCHYGLKFFYMGPNMNVETILEICGSVEANVILLSANSFVVPQKEDFLNNFMERLTKGMSKGQSLWLGGAARFNLAKFQKNKSFHFLPDLKYLDNYLKELS